MKFYLCQTPAGPVYARTQSDAKTLDKNFELVIYETDQGSLVDRFNALLKQGSSLNVDEPAHTDVIEEDEPAHIEVSKPKKPGKAIERDEHGQRQWDAISIEEFIFGLEGKATHMIAGIERVCKARLEELG